MVNREHFEGGGEAGIALGAEVAARAMVAEACIPPQYFSQVEGGGAAEQQDLSFRATVSGPQRPTNPKPTTGTSGTHPK